MPALVSVLKPALTGPGVSAMTSKAEDFGIIAWHEDGRWNVSELTHVRDLGSIMDQLNSQATNGGAIALIAIEEDYFVVARALGSQMQMMISDVTYALESDLAADLLEMLDLPFPEEEDDSQPGGDIDLLSDLGMSAMELEALCDDPELFPDEQLDAIASKLGFGNQFAELYESQ
jgi:putative tRNA adenosine deaminase-associated protein